jgi:hypothetical protein
VLFLVPQWSSPEDTYQESSEKTLGALQHSLSTKLLQTPSSLFPHILWSYFSRRLITFSCSVRTAFLPTIFCQTHMHAYSLQLGKMFSFLLYPTKTMGPLGQGSANFLCKGPNSHSYVLWAMQSLTLLNPNAEKWYQSQTICKWCMWLCYNKPIYKKASGESDFVSRS